MNVSLDFFFKLYQEVGLKSENELFPRSKHLSQTLKMTFSLTFLFPYEEHGFHTWERMHYCLCPLIMALASHR